MRIDGLERTARDGQVELSARVSGLNGTAPSRLWFRFPEAYGDAVTTDADPFLAAMLPTAVALRQPLNVEGRVFWRLLPQARQIMEIWDWRWPRVRPVEIDAAATWDGRHGGTAVASFFSGGVDSFYTVLKNLDLEQGESRLTHLICALGFDLRPENEEMYATVLKRVREVAASLGVEVIPVRTNIRAFSDGRANWQWRQMGAGLAAVGLALGPFLRRVLIPSGDTHLPSILYAPSNALLDPLFSTDSTEFVHDGCEATRLQKVMWRVARSPVALDHLRVCLQNQAQGARPLYNCGDCAKCVRTMLSLHVAGVLAESRTFGGRPITAEQVRGLADMRGHAASYLEEMLAVLRAEDREPELQEALRFAVRGSRGFLPRLRAYWGLDVRVAMRRGLRMLRRRR